jgi:hypothetical protein
VEKPLKLAVEVTRHRPSIRALGVDGSSLDEDVEELSEAELQSLATLDVLELELDLELKGSEPSSSLRERFTNLRELDTNRVLPVEYENW